jgi:hypothetical protein
MSSYAGTIRAQDQETREAKQAIASTIRRLLESVDLPSDADIASLAARHVVAAATSILLDIIRPHVANKNTSAAVISLFLPRQAPELHAYMCGVAFKCFSRSGTFTPAPLETLRTRVDPKAILARTACGDLHDWPRADEAARAIIVLRKVIPTSIELRGRHG